MKKLSIAAFACAMTLGFGLSEAQSITPTRVGPVSQYGQLMSGKNSAGEGRIYGSCQGVKDGAEVQVRGMSLYWSLQPKAVEFWSEAGITTMVNDMNIQLIRASMATGSEDWWGCKDMSSDCGSSNHMTGYASDPDYQKNLVSTVVEAAIKNDIYVIIDWHSHDATSQTSSAQGFFSEMAQKYGSYDNVIFEVFNEPTDIEWSSIKSYADQVISTIRQYSDNLILVGNRAWDQHPEEAIGNEVVDSGNNHAYTLHYYAMSHCVSGTYDYGAACEGTNGLTAMKAGLSIFLSEWGTGTADGGGTPGTSENQTWQDYANQYKLSWANWSASKIDEGTAAFTSSASASSLQYTSSGTLVKSYLATNPTTYTKCTDPSVTPSTNPTNPDTSSAILAQRIDNFNVSFAGKTLNVSGATASVEVFNIMGTKLMSLENIAGDISFASFPAGKYLIRAKAASMVKTKVIEIK